LGFQQQRSWATTTQPSHQSLLTEADFQDVALAMQFPQAQRLFVMFLQAADSHRLNTSLIRQVFILMVVLGMAFCLKPACHSSKTAADVCKA